MILGRIEIFLKITGLIVLAIGVALGFADLRGWLQDSEKVSVLDWVLKSPIGLRISHPGAQKFMEKFPPPKDANPEEITHLTKHVMRVQNGPIQNASINYMQRDGTRTSYVATLSDVKEWAVETRYPFFSWLFSLIGFFEVFGGFLLERFKIKRGKANKVNAADS
jgi:hypothetical protein